MSSVGLDVGGTYLKAAWLDDAPMQVTRRPIPHFIDTSGKAREIEPAGLMDSISELLDDVIGSGKCDRIFITGQMAGLARVDGRGRPVAPIISWQDTRFDAVDHVKQQLTSEDLSRLGDGLRVGLPLVTLHAMRVGTVTRITSLIGFIAGSMVKTFPSSMHVTDAASLGLLNVSLGAWSPAALAAAHIDRDQLPDPSWGIKSLGVASRYEAEVFTPVGDQQAALLGVALKKGQVSMNIATGCQVSVVSSSSDSPAQLRPFFDHKFLHTVTHLPGGRLLTSALCQDLGRSPTSEDWIQAIQGESGGYPNVDAALEVIATSCVEAAKRICTPREVVFSGGIAQGVPRLRRAIHGLFPVPQTTHPGDDASLAGLRVLCSTLAY